MRPGRFTMCDDCRRNVHCGSCDCCPRRGEPSDADYQEVAHMAARFLFTTRPTDRALAGWSPSL